MNIVPPPCLAGNRRPARNTLYFYALLMLVGIFAGGCQDDGGGDAEVSPPGGTYDDAIGVQFNIDDYDNIYYTLDGTEPSENCLEYLGGVISITQTTLLKYVVWKNGVPGPVTTVPYQIGSGSSTSATDFHNEDMGNAWFEYEGGTRQIFMDNFLGGCEPVVGCSGNGLVLSHLGSYFICDDPTKTTESSCDAAGGGWITWAVLQEGFGGSSVFTYSDYSFGLAEGCNLSISGQIVGHFNASGTGSTTTGEGVTLSLSGCYEGTIDISASVTDRIQDGGFLQIFCSNDGSCSPNTEYYLIAAGAAIVPVPGAAVTTPTITLYEQSDVEPSCTQPFYVIRNRNNDRCLQGMGDYTTLGHLTCTNYEEQRWSIKEDTATAFRNDYMIQAAHSDNMCMTIDDTNFFGFYMPYLSTCGVNNNLQRFTFVGSGENVMLKPDVVKPNGGVGCISSDLFSMVNNTVFGWWNCDGSLITSYGIFQNGTFPAIAPVCIRLGDPNCSATTYSVGGIISGLVNDLTTTLKLNNAGELFPNGSFTFANTFLFDEDIYTVAVAASPGHDCLVTAGDEGVIATADVTDVVVNCTPLDYTVSGDVTGLDGGTITLELNGSEQLPVSMDGVFDFASTLYHTDEYTVTILIQPADRLCVIDNGTGTGAIAAANVTDVSISCTADTRYVFASSATYNGALGGLAGADAECLALADASTDTALHGKTWMAWLSTSAANSEPAQRMVQFPLDYVRQDGVAVANSWSGLVSGTLLAPINVDESGVLIVPNPLAEVAWTNTTETGVQDSALLTETCQDWTSDDSMDQGWIGTIDAMDDQWSRAQTLALCSVMQHIYCIEQ